MTGAIIALAWEQGLYYAAGVIDGVSARVAAFDESSYVEGHEAGAAIHRLAGTHVRVRTTEGLDYLGDLRMKGHDLWIGHTYLTVTDVAEIREV